MTVTVGVDLGKTHCRATVSRDERVLAEAVGAGTRGLADPGGVAAAHAAVVATVAEACARAGLPGDQTLDVVLVGAAGAEAAGRSGPGLVDLLAGGLRARTVAVTSDAVISHAGAFSGGPGAMVAVGTGAVGVGVGPRGLVQVDGLGYWLGDDGSGAWLGRAALRAALRAEEGRGPGTALLDAARERYGDLAVLPATLAAGDTVAATTAAFARDVVGCAERGDDVACALLTEAGALLAGTVAAAARAAGVDLVTAVGGLAAVEPLLEGWRAALPEELTAVPARGTALDGAGLLARRADLPHEERVVRLAAGRPAANGERVDGLATEQVRRDLADLDRRAPAELVDTLLAAEATVPAAVGAARAAIAAAVALVEQAWEAGGRLVYVGAGTPGRLAALDAAECPPTFGIDPDRVVAVLAGGGEAAAAAVEGAEDRADLGRQDLLDLGVDARDVVVGITASGRTPYVLAALETARERGAHTVAIVNNPGSVVARAADLAIELLTGPEVLAGSTRMKAGTSQKVTLNVLSTASMMRLGKTYGAWMVDVQAANEKLRLRARRLLREATGVSDDEAHALLVAADWQTKTALVAILASVDVDRARELLDASGGRVRPAVEAARGMTGGVAP